MKVGETWENDVATVSIIKILWIEVFNEEEIYYRVTESRNGVIVGSVVNLPRTVFLELFKRVYENE